MKKKLISIFLCFTMLLISAACTADRDNNDNDQNDNTERPVIEGKLPKQKVKIMSMNIDANESTMQQRAGGLISVLKSHDPDSIGVQECRGGWNMTLYDGLRDKYARVGIAADGQDESSSSFATYIFYKKDKYNVVDSGTFWLSKTPDVPSIYGSTVDCNRTCTWAIFEDKKTGFKYVHMNSHLDWMDVKATDYQISLIRDQILRFEAMGLPVFATGDYNTDEGTDTYKLMLQNDKIADSKFIAKKTMSLGTYPDYGAYDVTKTKPIDFCFVTKDNMSVIEYKVVDDKPKGKYISDHNGLLIHAEVNELDNSFKDAPKPDISELKIDTVLNGTYLTVNFTPVNNRYPIVKYMAKLSDETGKEIRTRTVKSGYMNENTPDELKAMFTLPNKAGKYKIDITAVNLFGALSDKVSFDIKTETEIKPIETGKADLFDLTLDADGKFVDASDSHMKISVLGNVVPGTDGKLIAEFNKKGCLKIPEIVSQYDTLSQGFSSETYVTVNSTDGIQSFFSNMHAGGFGYEIENGVLYTYLFCGGEYKTISFDAEEGRTYHLVTVYDGSSISLYIDGVLEDAESTDGDMGFATDPGAKFLCIGADSDASGSGENFADVKIYSARLYSKALNAGEVLYLYQNATK